MRSKRDHLLSQGELFAARSYQITCIPRAKGASSEWRLVYTQDGRLSRRPEATVLNLRAPRGLLGINAGLLTHGSENDDIGVLPLLGEELFDLVTNVTFGELDVVLGLARIIHEVEETVVNVKQLVLFARDVGNVHVVSRRRQILVLLAVEDVGSNEMDLGVTVLSSLGGRHVDNLAGAALDDDETVLTQSRALHGEGQRRAGIGRLEGSVVLRINQGQQMVHAKQ
jgi:hypothetical protein